MTAKRSWNVLISERSLNPFWCSIYVALSGGESRGFKRHSQQKGEREREGERERRKKKSDKERGISQQEGRARDVCVVSNICMFASNEILILLFG